jgi:hypothetical protein
VRAALEALQSAGATRCSLVLNRDGDWLRLRLQGDASDELDESLTAADAVAFEAYGGRLAWTAAEGAVVLAGELSAPADGMDRETPHEPPDEGIADLPAPSADVAAEDQPPSVVQLRNAEPDAA